MRKLYWGDLKADTPYLILEFYDTSSVKTGFLQEKVISPTVIILFKNIIHLIDTPNHENYDERYCFRGSYVYNRHYDYYELSPYLQEIRDYKPKKFPSLHSLAKYQLSTEEIRGIRMYDGLF